MAIIEKVHREIQRKPSFLRDFLNSSEENDDRNMGDKDHSCHISDKERSILLNTGGKIVLVENK